MPPTRSLWPSATYIRASCHCQQATGLAIQATGLVLRRRRSSPGVNTALRRNRCFSSTSNCQLPTSKAACDVIAFLRGRVIDKQPNRVTVDVNGVGYELHVPLST